MTANSIKRKQKQFNNQGDAGAADGVCVKSEPHLWRRIRDIKARTGIPGDLIRKIIIRHGFEHAKQGAHLVVPEKYENEIIALCRPQFRSAARVADRRKWRAKRGAEPSVYFIQASLTGLIKIGHAVDVEARLKELRAMNADELTLLKVVPGTKDKEIDFHNRFADYRHHGEWFILGVQLEMYLQKHLAPQLSGNPGRFTAISARVG